MFTVNLEDRITIETPEGVAIDVTLAGLGSRLGAAIIDLLIQLAVLLVVLLAFGLVGSNVSEDLGVFLLGLGALAVALVIVGYYILFEGLNGGRTPGKRAFGLRVAPLDGGSLGMTAVTIRTLMRLIDFLPVIYAVGAISIAVSGRNQRLGDLAANTVVVRDRRQDIASIPELADSGRIGWDTSTVTAEELGLVRQFAGRRQSLAPGARAKLAEDLASRLRPKVGGGRDLDAEPFLLQLLAERND